MLNFSCSLAKDDINSINLSHSKQRVQILRYMDMRLCDSLLRLTLGCYVHIIIDQPNNKIEKMLQHIVMLVMW